MTKKIVREFSFSPEQLHTVKELAREMGLTVTTAGILFARGLDTAQKMRTFLHPSRANYLSPFLMRGMKEAVELITRARDESWRVAVYGDYDADGIGACAVISRALKRFGIEPYLYVPERTDGYGMSVAALDKIFDEYLPDLIITVDCGISNRKEVEYIKEQGTYVIVTDHHELPDELPDCIVIDPKLADDYPYDNLCGAGVALKLSQALIGKEADELSDFAALSTVADSVPLLGENRDIVAEGLRLIEKKPRPVFSALIGKAGEVTVQTLAFTVAPRVNAAGRMGDAASALKLFTSEDAAEIYELAAKLNAYNMERQKYCDELYVKAHADIDAEGAYGNVIMLAGEDWNAGFVGIVAARIAEEYARPALLFVRRGDMLKGSARSIENINIFEALKGCSEYITEFGGHAQAAGINVGADGFEALKEALDSYIGSHYTREDFIPVIPVAGEGEADFVKLARELCLLEPCGMGNRRPLFTVRAASVEASPIKPASPHLSMTLGGMDYVYFNGLKDLDILKSDLDKEIVFEYNVSHFRGKEYVKGFVRSVLYDGLGGEGVALSAFENALRLLPASGGGKPLSEQELGAFLGERTAHPYGLAVVAWNREHLSRFPALKDLPIDVFHPAASGCANMAVYAPSPDCDLSSFREVVVLGNFALLPKFGKEVYFCPTLTDMVPLEKVSCDREDLLRVFAAVKKCEGTETGESYAETAVRLRLNFAKEQVVFALAVFEELGILSLAGGRIAIIRGEKKDLTDSAVYRAVSAMKEGKLWKAS